LVGIIFASFYEGAVSYIYFASRVFEFPLALTGISIATVLIPSLSSKIKLNDMVSALSFQNKAYKLSVAAIFPATIILVILSSEIIQFIFERGEFSSESTLNTAMVLKLFSLGLPAMCLSKILTPYFFAKENPTVPFRITTISVLINLLLTAILFQFIGFFSIPLSISITAFLTLYMYCLRHKKESFFLFSPEIIKHTLKYIMFSFILSIEIVGMKSLLYSYSLNSSYSLLVILTVCLLTYVAFIKIYDKDLIEDIKGLSQNTPN
jgi:putative peptidoglycan lipid II flippase